MGCPKVALGCSWAVLSGSWWLLGRSWGASGWLLGRPQWKEGSCSAERPQNLYAFFVLEWTRALNARSQLASGEAAAAFVAFGRPSESMLNRVGCHRPFEAPSPFAPLVDSCAVSSSLVSSCLVSSYLVPSVLASSCPDLSSLVPSCLVSSCLL